MTPQLDPDRHRKRAAALATAMKQALEPMIAAHLKASEPPAPVVRLKNDDRLRDAARHVAAALDRLDQAKFSPAEIPARRALEKAARKLAQEVKNGH